MLLMSFSYLNFGRYVPQTEQSTNETNGTNEWSSVTPSASNNNDTSTFLPAVAIPSPSPPPSTPSILPANNAQNITMSQTTINDELEALPFPQHGPGPIQRPNKLTNQPMTTTTSPYLPNTIQSPETSEVFYQMNRFIDQQNLSTSNSSPTTANINNSSVPIADLPTPNIPWTPFAQTEWSPKYDPSWPMSDIQSSTIPLTTSVRNPFALITAINEQQRVPNNEDATVWSTALGTATPRLVPSNMRAQRIPTWNDIFQSTTPSPTTELSKPANNSWLWSVSDPSSTDVVGTSNDHQTNANHLVWNLNALSNEHVIPSTISNVQQVVSPAGWWSNSTSDENNNTSQTNRFNGDHLNNRDQSRWDFAR